MIDFVDLITILIDVRGDDPESPYWSLAKPSCGASGEQIAKPVVGFAFCFNGRILQPKEVIDYDSRVVPILCFAHRTTSLGIISFWCKSLAKVASIEPQRLLKTFAKLIFHVLHQELIRNSGTGIQVCDKVSISRPANNVNH